MTLQHSECIALLCDDCGDDCWEDTGGTPHFESIEQARNYVGEDWLFTDTEQVCRGCLAKRQCKTEGHVWGEWIAPPGDLAVLRFCERCPAHDYTVAAGGAP